MKLTPAKRNWVSKKINHYCSLLKIETPNVFLTMAEYDQWKKEKRLKTGKIRVGRSNCLGVCHKRDNFIVILVKRAKNLDSLDETIRHELIHFSKPSYNHYSKEFKDRMKKLKLGKIKNGRF